MKFSLLAARVLQVDGQDSADNWLGPSPLMCVGVSTDEPGTAVRRPSSEDESNLASDYTDVVLLATPSRRARNSRSALMAASRRASILVRSSGSSSSSSSHLLVM